MIKKSPVLLWGLLLAVLSACTVNVFLPSNPSVPPTAQAPIVVASVASATAPPLPVGLPAGASGSASTASAVPASVAADSGAPTPSPVQTPNFLPSPSVSHLPFVAPSTPPELPPPSTVPPAIAPSSSSSFSFSTPMPTPSLASPSPGLTPTPVPTVNPDPRTYSATIVLTASKSAIFTPGNFSLNVGDTLTWKNVFSSGQTLLSNEGLFGDQYLLPSASYSYTFTKAGKYKFVIRLAGGYQGVIVK